MNALACTFNQEKALEGGAFSVIVNFANIRLELYWQHVGIVAEWGGDDICGATLSYIELSASSAGVSPVSSRAFLNWV